LHKANYKTNSNVKILVSLTANAAFVKAPNLTVIFELLKIFIPVRGVRLPYGQPVFNLKI
jgi:hypothetical protein